MKIHDQFRPVSGTAPAGIPVHSNDLDGRQSNVSSLRTRRIEVSRTVSATIKNALRAAAARAHTYLLERGTIRALSRLSDHALKELGLHRSEIRRVARDFAAGRPAPVVKAAPMRSTTDRS